MSSQAAFRESASISSFEGLPTELLLIIRNFIGYGCLADHICFAFTCTRFKALYPSDKWQDLLRLGGHGKPLDIDWLQRHHLPAHNIWEDLAIAIARHTRSCKFDPCNSYFSDCTCLLTFLKYFLLTYMRQSKLLTTSRKVDSHYSRCITVLANVKFVYSP